MSASTTLKLVLATVALAQAAHHDAVAHDGWQSQGDSLVYVGVPTAAGATRLAAQ